MFNHDWIILVMIVMIESNPKMIWRWPWWWDMVMMKDDITIAKMIAMIEHNQSNNKSLMTKKWSRISTNILECNQYQFQHDLAPEQLKRRVLQGSQSDHGSHTWKPHHNHHISRHLCKQIWHNCSHYCQPLCKNTGWFFNWPTPLFSTKMKKGQYAN